NLPRRSFAKGRGRPPLAWLPRPSPASSRAAPLPRGLRRGAQGAAGARLRRAGGAGRLRRPGRLRRHAPPRHPRLGARRPRPQAARRLFGRDGAARRPARPGGSVRSRPGGDAIGRGAARFPGATLRPPRIGSPPAAARRPNRRGGGARGTAARAVRGGRPVHGPVGAGSGGAPPDPRRRRFGPLESDRPPPPLVGRTVVAGEAEGPLVGGCLSLLVALLGTPHFPRLDGAILFLEDVGEAPYRLDRMLTQLRASGALDRVAGIALGEWAG